MVQESTYEDVAGQAIMGQSLEGTDMKVIQICRGGDCNNGKPDMYIEGGIHARQVLNGYCQGRSLLAIVLCLSLPLPSCSAFKISYSIGLLETC